MVRWSRRSLILLLALLTSAGCAGFDGILGIDTTTTASTTTTTEAPATTVPDTTTVPTTTTTTTTLPPTTTTTLPLWGVECPAEDAACTQRTADGAAYLDANTDGGRYGFYFARINHGTVASLNPIETFYPASAIKILHHIYAIRWVGDQPDPQAALLTPVPVYENFCAASGEYWTETLSAVLQEMMLRSLDQYTDAIQDHFGRENINQMAQELIGLQDSLLAHRFGCGGASNNPPNRSTAADLAWIYRQIAAGGILTEQEREILESLMLGPTWPMLERVVRDEGADLGLDDATVQGFLDGMNLLYKAGWLAPWYTLGGYLHLPAPACGGPEWEYAFGIFQVQASWRDDDFNVSDLVSVVLRSEIRRALEATAAGC